MKKNLRKDILMAFLQGISVGSLIINIIIVMIRIFGTQEMMEVMMHQYVENFAAGVGVALVFSLLSLIYEHSRLPILVKTLLHLGPGFTVYFLTAYFMNWLPLELSFGILLGCCIFMLAAGIGVWAGFFLYYKKEAEQINRQIQNIE